MSGPRCIKPDTLSLHAGQRPDPVHGARAVPIYQTPSYVFDATGQSAALCNLERAGPPNSRRPNSTLAVLEARAAVPDRRRGAVRL